MNDTWFLWNRNSLTLHLYIQPGAKENAICGLFNHCLKIKIRARPVAGKANKALIELLSNEFRIGKSNIRISKGKLGRNKTIVIETPGKLPDWFVRYTNR